jgi:hypothetical protein
MYGASEPITMLVLGEGLHAALRCVRIHDLAYCWRPPAFHQDHDYPFRSLSFHIFVTAGLDIEQYRHSLEEFRYFHGLHHRLAIIGSTDSFQDKGIEESVSSGCTYSNNRWDFLRQCLWMKNVMDGLVVSQPQHAHRLASEHFDYTVDFETNARFGAVRSRDRADDVWWFSRRDHANNSPFYINEVVADLIMSVEDSYGRMNGSSLKDFHSEFAIPEIPDIADPNFEESARRTCGACLGYYGSLSFTVLAR